MMESIKGLTLDAERALYNTCDKRIEQCIFSGYADGESALKECRNIEVSESVFMLRYPLWHTKTFTLVSSKMGDTCRAPIWYSSDGKIENCEINGVKFLRECDNIAISNCRINSDEAGWKCRNVNVNSCDITSDYLFFECENLNVTNLVAKGKYSFQYVKNLIIENASLDTKDAFWHAENVTVKSSVIRGEYIGWYSKNLTLINCKIIGRQPLCCCENLTLVNCETEKCDLAFEYSHVNADIRGEIVSVKNPKSGKISADKIGEVILENSIMPTTCIIENKSLEQN